MFKLLFASFNAHKAREIKDMAKTSPLELCVESLNQTPTYHAPEENGKTFEDNALIKARQAHHHFKDLYILAEDSGLVVPALGGEPGIFSARYSGPQANDYKNRQKLLEKMLHLNGSQRQAYFQSAFALILPSGEENTFTATCEGYIAKEEKGSNGFGYDALFIKHDYEKSFAQLDESIKNKISHRRKALDKVLTFLEKLPVSA